MQISLLTLHSPANYGSNLQAFAMVRMIESHGHSVEVLDYRTEDDERYYDQVTSGRQRQAHEEFIRDFLPLSPRLASSADVRDHIQRTCPDGLVVGSDAVLRIAPGPRQREVNRFGNAFWLEWLDDLDPEGALPSAMFSASCMGSTYPMLPVETQERIRNCMTRRRYVSVRDLWTKWMLESLEPGPSVKVRLSPDPVFWLRDRADSAVEVTERLRLPDRYIVISFVRQCWPDVEWIGRLKTLAHRQGLRIAELPDPDGGFTARDIDWTPTGVLSPFEWLAVIAGAQGYVGTRFHAVVVALMCGVPFVAVDPYGIPGGASSTANFPSKTFDLCLRAGHASQVLSPTEVCTSPPERVLALLASARADAKTIEALQGRLQCEAQVMLDRLFRG